MPFTMTHLHIAKKIHEYLPDSIIDIPQLYLGNIAPDAVHNRENYISDNKKTSHLCVGNECWGMITNNEEWIASVQDFLYEHRNSENHDFILGYCTHILADIYNNIAVWTPFKQKYQDELSKGFGGLYHQESEKVDIELALAEENKVIFWPYIEKGKAVSLDNIIYANEVEKQKENILCHWFKDKEHQDISSHKIVTIDSTLKFIDEAAGFVSGKIISIIT